ncbi:MAG TPA: efflux RND transporter permease subunit [Fimbriimonadaceae bacterium]|jgi:multidrug efflux pump subunit AcrB
MWIVKLALRDKHTFIVLAVLIFLLGTFSITRMSTDVFPSIDIPVVSVIWSYNGLAPTDMEKRIVTISERAATTTVSNIEHIESQSLPGISVEKFYFQPGANVQQAVAELTSISQTLLRAFPQGTTPPLILQYSASSVPILQLGLSSPSMSESQLYDTGTNIIRTQLATVQGASIPLPYGGKSRLVSVDIDNAALQAKGLTPNDLDNAINAQNLILPTGTQKIGDREYNILMNSSPPVAAQIGDLPIKTVNGATIFVRDVATVHDGFAPQSNIVNINGHRSALMTVLKTGNASTLDVVGRIQQRLPQVETTLPKDLKVDQLFDQSIFVRATINGVVREAVLAALLTAAMILLFLGSWRSTLIVTVSIPLSILSSIVLLNFLGNTLNIMTLGGLALAVGILVDDATVTIENIHRHMEEGGSLRNAILIGAGEIAVPTLVSTLSICLVFVSVVFLTGPAKFLFTPMALAVVFAMMSSYILSRTLVPVMTMLMLPKEAEEIQRKKAAERDGSEADLEPRKKKSANPFVWIGGLLGGIYVWFSGFFEKINKRYERLLQTALHHRKLTALGFGIFFVLSFCLLPFIGRDFFPTVDAGQVSLHVIAPPGTRIEDTAHIFDAIETDIRKIIPKKELGTVVQNIGLPASGINLAFGNSATISAADGDILIALEEGHHPTAGYQAEIREKLHKDFPNETFFFGPADIVSQILDFGLSSPIDLQISGRDPKNYQIAQDLAKEIKAIPGAVDVHVQQVTKVPSLFVNVDRNKASGVGITQRDVATSLLVALSGTGQTAPNFWLDPKNGVSYSVSTQTPQYKLDSLQALGNIPVNPSSPVPGQQSAENPSGQQVVENLANVDRTVSAQNISHYNVQPTYDVLVDVAGRDLGGVSSDINNILEKYKNKMPKSTQTNVRGQVQSMNSSFLGLGTGIAFAIIFVYLLMVVNFQTWIDPFIILMALPGAFSGILWMLFATNTTFSVPSLMGAIMAVGVATANSILVITFANDRRKEGDDALQAALKAGGTRLRPVLMTALAMIIGMMPMALGLGEGGEQNAPLGRAVIGGLLVATVTTLFLVPVIYSRLRVHQPHAEPEDDDVPGQAPIPAPAH